VKASQLKLAPDQRNFRPRRIRLQDSLPLRSLKQLSVQLLGLRLGLSPELALQHADTDLILAECGTATTVCGVEPHQRSVHGFLRGIEPENPDRRLHRGLGRANPDLVGQEPDQRLQRLLAEALALEGQPLLEWWLGHR
jgi:hypothetical protein